jgi:hypothetical protein
MIYYLRKPYPFRLFQEPILESEEHHVFEAENAPAKVMRFEKWFMVINALEKTVIYPLLFLIAMTSGASELTRKWSLT